MHVYSKIFRSEKYLEAETVSINEPLSWSRVLSPNVLRFIGECEFIKEETGQICKSAWPPNSTLIFRSHYLDLQVISKYIYIYVYNIEYMYSLEFSNYHIFHFKKIIRYYIVTPSFLTCPMNFSRLRHAKTCAHVHLQWNHPLIWPSTACCLCCRGS